MFAPKEPAGGRVGSTVAASYTGNWPYRVFWLGTAVIALHDVLVESGRFSSVAFGIAPFFLSILFLLIGKLLLMGPSLGVLYSTYSCYSGKRFRDDRIGFGKSGGRDIGIWTAVFSWFGSIILFTFAVPRGLFGMWRWAVFLVVHEVGQAVMALAIAHIVWSKTIGRPQSIMAVLRKVLTCDTSEIMGAPSDLRKNVDYQELKRSHVVIKQVLLKWHDEKIAERLGITAQQLRKVPTTRAWASSPDRIIKELGTTVAASFCRECGQITYEEGELSIADVWYRNALQMCEEIFDTHMCIWLLREMAMIASEQGDYSRSEDYIRRALVLEDL